MGFMMDPCLGCQKCVSSSVGWLTEFQSICSVKASGPDGTLDFSGYVSVHVGPEGPNLHKKDCLGR